MEFDIKRVYSAVNADEVKAGSMCFFANSLGRLRDEVEALDTNPEELQIINDEYSHNRFVTSSGLKYSFCYLVSEPEEKKLKWTDLKIGDIIRKKAGTSTGIVTNITDGSNVVCHIFAGEWLNNEELEEWEKVE